jgi:hypothetical protein
VFIPQVSADAPIHAPSKVGYRRMSLTFELRFRKRHGGWFTPQYKTLAILNRRTFALEARFQKTLHLSSSCDERVHFLNLAFRQGVPSRERDAAAWVSANKGTGFSNGETCVTRKLDNAYPPICLRKMFNVDR